MKRETTIRMAAAAVIGLGTMAGITRAQQATVHEEEKTTYNKESQEATTPLQLPAGVKAKAEASSSGMYSALARVTEYALTKDGLKDVVDQFASADRDRMGKAAKEEEKEKKLNDLVASIDKEWQDKYHKKFSMDADKVFSGAKAVEGEVTDPKALAEHWPVPVMSGMAQPAAAVGGAVAKEDELKKGHNVGIVRLPAAGEMGALDVSMQREWLRWKIDVPDNRTAAEVHDDLIKQLTAFEQNKANWPADENEAYRHAARHVIMALYGVEGTPARAG